MGVLFRSLPLEPGEQLVWTVACNWVQHGLARGGRLGLTQRALLFEPHRVDAGTGAVGVRIPLAHLASADVAPVRLADLFAGGLRRRLRIRLRTGDEALLVVNRVAHRAAELSAAITAAHASAGGGQPQTPGTLGAWPAGPAGAEPVPPAS